MTMWEHNWFVVLYSMMDKLERETDFVKEKDVNILDNSIRDCKTQWMAGDTELGQRVHLFPE